ncbi:YgaP-like transmembrane domain [Lichenibacterium dinghuense]|uniref:YgaP-like transmembrane domain n=1 Tax=Lichenibacterium dinghuense TaxID=2895977 RepID=UPI001F31D49C|nr:YgaP-like transmembrane domain [Lichenibacterium sp. 6Y81]
MTRDPAGELSMKERAISTGIGLFLAASAAKPRPNKVLSVLALLGGAALAYRGTTGYCPAKAALAAQR